MRPTSSVSVRIAGRLRVRNCAHEPFWNRHSRPCLRGLLATLAAASDRRWRPRRRRACRARLRWSCRCHAGRAARRTTVATGGGQSPSSCSPSRPGSPQAHSRQPQSRPRASPCARRRATRARSRRARALPRSSRRSPSAARVPASGDRRPRAPASRTTRAAHAMILVRECAEQRAVADHVDDARHAAGEPVHLARARRV